MVLIGELIFKKFLEFFENFRKWRQKNQELRFIEKNNNKFEAKMYFLSCCSAPSGQMTHLHILRQVKSP